MERSISGVEREREDDRDAEETAPVLALMWAGDKVRLEIGMPGEKRGRA